MAPCLGLSVAKPPLHCTDSGCGVSAARAQLIWNPDTSLAGNSGGRACSMSVKLHCSLPTLFLSRVPFLSTVIHTPKFLMAKHRTELPSSYKLLSHLFSFHSPFPHSITSPSLVDCCLLALSSAVPPLLPIREILLCQWKSVCMSTYHHPACRNVYQNKIHFINTFCICTK